MRHHSVPLSHAARQTKKRTIFIAIVVILVIFAIALETKIVKTGSAEDTREQRFSAEQYAVKAFPEIKQYIESHAVDAQKLRQALQENKQQAIETYGKGTPLAVFPISFTGIADAGKMGIYTMRIQGFPDNMIVRLQTGPAINGTDLRDATGQIQFGLFKNQIQYQNVASAINNVMKKTVLDKQNTAHLSGKMISVVGVFRLINPGNWLVTPVKVEIHE